MYLTATNRNDLQSPGVHLYFRNLHALLVFVADTSVPIPTSTVCAASIAVAAKTGPRRVSSSF